jgi:ribonuclease E
MSDGDSMAVEQAGAAAGKKKTTARKKTKTKTTKTKKTTKAAKTKKATKRKKKTAKTAAAAEAATAEAAVSEAATSVEAESSVAVAEGEAPPKKARRTTKRIKRTKSAKRSATTSGAGAKTSTAEQDEQVAGSPSTDSARAVEPRDPSSHEGSSDVDTTLVAVAGTESASGGPSARDEDQEGRGVAVAEPPVGDGKQDSETVSGSKRRGSRRRSQRKGARRSEAAQAEEGGSASAEAAGREDTLVAGRVPSSEDAGKGNGAPSVATGKDRDADSSRSRPGSAKTTQALRSRELDDDPDAFGHGLTDDEPFEARFEEPFDEPLDEAFDEPADREDSAERDDREVEAAVEEAKADSTKRDRTPKGGRAQAESADAGDAEEGEGRSRRGRRRRGRRGRRGGDRKDKEANDGQDDAPAARKGREKAEAADDDTSEPAPLPVPGEDISGFVPKPVAEDEPIPKAKVATLGRGREMIVNVSGDDECRIAILANGKLEELFIERASTESHVGNIYKGRITNVEPSIQAAFVDFGLSKNGFLHISDVQPQYFPDYKGEGEDVGRKTPRRSRPPIQQCFRRGQEVIVQVTKEGVGTKGPTLTAYLSIPGRFLVMMPGMSRHGVSRKIEDESIRREMRDMMSQLELPTGMGFIMRTAGLGRAKKELQADLSYLTRLWKSVVQRIRNKPAPAELYRESDLITRSIRDVYTSDFERVVVDNVAVARKAKEFLRVAQPRTKTPVELYAGGEPLFHRLGIEAEIERIHQRHVPLSSGGSLVIESTEAMVTIDVNSGKFRSPENAEETAYKINLEAAEEIARQLRLRDLGGLIVCDFIDMREDRHKRAVERSLRDALRSHKERARILRMSAFGLIEMTRQRQRASILRNVYHDCPQCQGRGIIRMAESVVLDVMRVVQLAAHRQEVETITVTAHPEVAVGILNRRRASLCKLEDETGAHITVVGNASFRGDQVEYECRDQRQREVPIFPNGDNGR